MNAHTQTQQTTHHSLSAGTFTLLISETDTGVLITRIGATMFEGHQTSSVTAPTSYAEASEGAQRYSESRMMQDLPFAPSIREWISTGNPIGSLHNPSF